MRLALISRTLLLVAGCISACAPKSPEETRLEAHVVWPVNGSIVDLASDVDPLTEGIQVDVVVRGADSGGRNVIVNGGMLTVESDNGVEEFTTTEFDGDRATFRNVTLGNGRNALIVQLSETNTWDAESEIEVTAASTRPNVGAVALPQDTNADGILNLEELPGANDAPVLRVTTQALAVGGTLHVVTEEGTVVASDVLVDPSGVTDVPLDRLTFPLGEVELGLVVRLRTVNGVGNNTGEPQPGDPLDEFARLSLFVDRTPPSVTILTPGAGLFATTRDLDVSVYVTGAPEAEVALSVDDGTSGPVALAPLTLDANGFASGTRNFGFGVLVLTASVTDAAGNTTEVTRGGVEVGCSIVFTRPNGLVSVNLGAADDEDPGTPNVLDYTLEGVARNCGGQTVSLVQDNGAPVTAVADADGLFSFSVVVPGSTSSTFVAAVTDPTGVDTNVSTMLVVGPLP